MLVAALSYTSDRRRCDTSCVVKLAPLPHNCFVFFSHCNMNRVGLLRTPSLTSLNRSPATHTGNVLIISVLQSYPDLALARRILPLNVWSIGTL